MLNHFGANHFAARHFIPIAGQRRKYGGGHQDHAWLRHYRPWRQLTEEELAAEATEVALPTPAPPLTTPAPGQKVRRIVRPAPFAELPKVQVAPPSDDLEVIEIIFGLAGVRIMPPTSDEDMIAILMALAIEV